ncbi:MAG: hypothetical protein WCF69_12620 [Mycobacterium sp.]
MPGRRYEDWDLDDPARKDVAAIRPIRDEIERCVRQLLDDLRIPPVLTRAERLPRLYRMMCWCLGLS